MKVWEAAKCDTGTLPIKFNQNSIKFEFNQIDFHGKLCRIQFLTFKFKLNQIKYRKDFKLILKSNRFWSAGKWRPSGDRCALVTEILAGFGILFICILRPPHTRGNAIRLSMRNCSIECHRKRGTCGFSATGQEIIRRQLCGRLFGNLVPVGIDSGPLLGRLNEIGAECSKILRWTFFHWITVSWRELFDQTQRNCFQKWQNF